MRTERPVLFLDRLRASDLLDRAQLAELARCPEARSTDPRALARVVLERGWLTTHQLNLVAQGRGRELHVGAYVLLEKLGEGGMGAVYKAQQRRLNRLVALKVIRKDKLRSAATVRRFYREVQAAGQLHHPNIVHAYDAGQAGGTHYLAMEYVEGTDLAQLVRQHGPLPVPQACAYVRQAALGLQHACKRGLVHRDIKPSNLLVTRAAASAEAAPSSVRPGPEGVVKILDMGLARLQGPAEGKNNLTRLGTVLGTPEYLAPEQALNARTADIRSDLYSLGCTLYFLLTGQPPFRGEDLSQVLLAHQLEQAVPVTQLRQDVPAQVQTILDRLMAKRPADRFQKPTELVAALDRLRPADAASSGPWAAVPERRVASAKNEWAALALGGPDAPPARNGRSGWHRLLVGLVAATLAVLLVALVVVGMVLVLRFAGAAAGSATLPAHPPVVEGVRPSSSEAVGPTGRYPATETPASRPVASPRPTERAASLPPPRPPVNLPAGSWPSDALRRLAVQQRHSDPSLEQFAALVHSHEDELTGFLDKAK
jgi:serine/threonine protein kinase